MSTHEHQGKAPFGIFRYLEVDSSFDSNHGEKLLSLAIHSEQQSQERSTKRTQKNSSEHSE